MWIKLRQRNLEAMILKEKDASYKEGYKDGFQEGWDNGYEAGFLNDTEDYGCVPEGFEPPEGFIHGKHVKEADNG